MALEGVAEVEGFSMKRADIRVLRTPAIGIYVVVDNFGFPRSVPSWSEVVNILLATTTDSHSEIEEIKPRVDGGEIIYFRYRGRRVTT